MKGPDQFDSYAEFEAHVASELGLPLGELQRRASAAYVGTAYGFLVATGSEAGFERLMSPPLSPLEALLFEGTSTAGKVFYVSVSKVVEAIRDGAAVAFSQN